MRFTPPRRLSQAVIFVRTGSDLPASFSPELQEAVCRRYCTDNEIPISHTVRVCCESEESLDVLRYLLRTLPKEVDSIFAMQFMVYSRQLKELGQLCLMYQCHPAWVYSLDLVQPIYKMLPTITPEDYLLTDQRYLDLLQNG